MAKAQETPRVRLHVELYRKIQKQAGEGLPNEICGYFSAPGAVCKDGEFLPEINIGQVHPMRNIDESSKHYSFNPAEQFEVLEKVSKAGGRLIGTYHSHPETPARMSDEDIRLAQDETMIYGIYSLNEEIINFFIVKKHADGNREVHKFSTEIVD